MVTITAVFSVDARTKFHRHSQHARTGTRAATNAGRADLEAAFSSSATLAASSAASWTQAPSSGGQGGGGGDGRGVPGGVAGDGDGGGGDGGIGGGSGGGGDAVSAGAATLITIFWPSSQCWPSSHAR